MQGPFGSCNWNEYNVNLLTRNNWRASLVPAAAVIPAPIAYIKVVAVKKLVVEFRDQYAGRAFGMNWCHWFLPSEEPSCHSVGVAGNQDCYFEKIRVFK